MKRSILTKASVLALLALLGIVIIGCPRTTPSTTTTSKPATEASVPENPPPSDITNLKNPLGVTAANIAAGRVLYQRSCWVCHGLDGQGDGPAASHMPTKPINFSTDHDFQTETDGQVWWIIREGINGTDMSDFKTVFSDNEIWQIEAYIIQFRANESDRKGFGTAGTTTTTSGGSTTTSGGSTTTGKSTTTTGKSTTTSGGSTTTSGGSTTTSGGSTTTS